jgi:hypothetical protein
MDPNACFQRLRDAIAAAKVKGYGWSPEWKAAFNVMEELFSWLKDGGFPPTVPPRTYIALGDGGPMSYSILSNPGGNGAAFIVYVFSRHHGQMWEHHTWNSANPQGVPA